MALIQWIAVVLISVAVAVLTGMVWVYRREQQRRERLWQSVETLADEDGNGDPFTEAEIAGLPEPVQRYFRHVIAPGTRLSRVARLTMEGEIRQKGGAWMPLTAAQVLAPGAGFVWNALARVGPVPMISVTDHYLGGNGRDDGRMRVALLGIVPVVNASGPDLTRSALGRSVIESVWAPATLLPRYGVEWTAQDDSHIAVDISAGGVTSNLSMTIDAKGAVIEARMDRYGDPDSTGQWETIPYGARVEDEATFGGYTIPSQLAIGWRYGAPDYEPSIRLRRVEFL